MFVCSYVWLHPPHWPLLPVGAAQGQPDYALATMGGRVLGHSPLLQHPSNAGLVDALGRLLGTHSVRPLADKVSRQGRLRRCIAAGVFHIGTGEFLTFMPQNTIAKEQATWCPIATRAGSSCSRAGSSPHPAATQPIRPLPPRPQFLLTPGASLGECLPLASSSGYVDIQLARAIHPTGLTYQHVPAAVAYDIRTAPRALAVHALDGPAADGASGSASPNASSRPAQGGRREATLLGQGTYDALHGRAAQHIAFAWPPEGRWPVGRVRVVVQSNHGHPNATCLYRIRVHGAAVGA